MKKLLTFNDYAIKAAKDIKELMKEVETFKPDIILLDVMFGGRTGGRYALAPLVVLKRKRNNPNPN